LKTYKFTSGSRFGADAQKVGEELDKLMTERDGKLATEEIVAAASDDSTELNRCFTWDDEVAGHKWRLQEARRLIRCVVVVENDEQAAPIAYNVKVGDVNHYASIDRLRRNEDEAASAIREASSRLAASERSLEQLRDVVGGEDNRERARRSARLVGRARQYVSEIQPTA